MIVTDKKYMLDKHMVALLDHCSLREKYMFDNLIIIDGVTGAGKTTLSWQMAYYYAFINKKEFSVDNIFFNADDLIEFAQAKRNQIIIWDESAFEGMSADWQNKSQKNLVKLVYTARKFGHFLIFIIPEFRKLQSVFALEKSVALIRVYLVNNFERGFWYGYGPKKKEILYVSEKKYNNNVKVLANIRGKFGKFDDFLDKNAYEIKKDKAISSIGNDLEKRFTVDDLLGDETHVRNIYKSAQQIKK